MQGHEIIGSAVWKQHGTVKVKRAADFNTQISLQKEEKEEFFLGFDTEWVLAVQGPDLYTAVHCVHRDQRESL